MSGPQEDEVELLRGRLTTTSPNSSSTSDSSGTAREHKDRDRRRSIPVKLRETGQAGQYILTAEDAELLLEVLRDNLRLEKSDPPRKRAFLFRDLQFTRQRSAFDRQNPSFYSSQFHGFFTLFWLGVALMLVKIAASNFRTYGTPFGTTEVIELMLSRDVLVLGITDLILCWSTLFCLGLQRAILRGYLRWSGFGWVIQNVRSLKIYPLILFVSKCRHLPYIPGLANVIPRGLHLVDIPSRLAMDPYRLYGLALLDHGDEAT